MTTFYLLILFMLPAVMAVGIAIPRRRELSAQWVGELVIATALLVLGALVYLLVRKNPYDENHLTQRIKVGA